MKIDYQQKLNELCELDIDQFADIIETAGDALLCGKASEDVESFIFSEQLLFEAHAILSQAEHKLRYLSLLNARETANNL